MMRLIVGCGLFVLAVVGPVYAGPAAPNCCACSIEGQAQALFCTSPTSEAEADAASARCRDIAGAEFLCLAKSVEEAGATDECVALLQESSINCPVSPAPALGNAALAGLAGMLSMLGAWRLRRRTARRG